MSDFAIAMKLAAVLSLGMLSCRSSQQQSDSTVQPTDAIQDVTQDVTQTVDTTVEPDKGETEPWTCDEQERFCQSNQETLPFSSGTWRCHLHEEDTWFCTGQKPNEEPEAGWACRELVTGIDLCTKPNGSEDRPTDDANWACVKGSAFDGTRCERLDQPPRSPTPFPRPDESCVPGTRRWCDGLQFSGWGTSTCSADGSWPTQIVNGKSMLSCQEEPNGRRADNLCGCYHFYFNPSCCERVDCVIPEGTQGTFCSESSGALCEPCNPQKPECTDGICAIANTMETFCTTPCDNGTCPAGMICKEVKSKGVTTEQCLPADWSCYDGL